MNEPTAVFVLATHRSGSSCLSGVLHHLGVNMGENLLGSGDCNPKGFFEDKDLVQFNMSIQESWPDMLFNVDEEAEQWYKRYVQRRDAENNIWGVKDPRLCALARYMIPHARNPKLILNFRSRNASIESLMVRDDFERERAREITAKHIQGQFETWSRFTEVPALIHFYEYLIDNTEITIREQLLPFLFEDYAEFVPEERIQAAIDFVDPDLQHHE